MGVTLTTFIPGTKIKSSEVNANFTALDTELFDIDESNLSASASIPDTKLATIITTNKVNGGAIVNETIDSVIGTFIWILPGSLTKDLVNPVGFPFRPAATLTCFEWYMEALTAPDSGGGGDGLEIDIFKDGVSLWSITPANMPTIADGATTGSGTNFDTTSLVKNNKLELYVNKVGATTPGGDVVLSLRVKQKVPQ